MVVLRFRSDEVRRDCCDLAQMRRRWGPVVARRISHRLQQLEGMTTLTDLSFLPFDNCEDDGRVLEIAVTDHVSLFIERGPNTSKAGAAMCTITGVGEHSRGARTS